MDFLYVRTGNDDFMQRYFVRSEQIQDHIVILDGEEAHHLIRVMRAKPGDQLIASDGLEREVLAEISQLDREANAVEARIAEELAMDQEPCVQVTVAQSLPKGDKLETVIQKGTELGAHRFLPFVSARTVVQYDAKKEAKRLERWRKIAKEAAEQAHRNLIPAVEAPSRWSDILQAAASFDIALMCYEQVGSSGTLRAILQQLREATLPAAGEGSASHAAPNKPSILLVVGPEGGFTDQEAHEAEQAGIRLVGLGSRILRTETAAMVGLACIMYEFNEMGGTH